LFICTITQQLHLAFAPVLITFAQGPSSGAVLALLLQRALLLKGAVRVGAMFFLSNFVMLLKWLSHIVYLVKFDWNQNMKRRNSQTSFHIVGNSGEFWHPKKNHFLGNFSEKKGICDRLLLSKNCFHKIVKTHHKENHWWRMVNTPYKEVCGC
jgi:hypothetical protein